MTASYFSTRHALVVAENPTARAILCETLKAIDLEVCGVASGEEALALLEKLHWNRLPQYLIIDWKLAGMDGATLAMQIKKHAGSASISTLLLITSYECEEALAQIEAARLEAVLTKPISPYHLHNTILALNNTAPSPPTPQAMDNNTPQTHLHGAHVLLVEDNLINQQVATELLKDMGLRVSIADNGKIAVEKIKQQHFDAVLMDIQMPEMDGHQATRIIRTDPRYEKLPIIAMTAHAMHGEREKSLQSGMNDHLTKPVNPDHLEAALARWIKRTPTPPSTPASAQATVRHNDSTLPDSVPGIDLRLGLRHVNQNQNLYRKLLGEILNDYRDIGPKIRHALQNNEIAFAQRTAHTMKGMAASLGAGPLQKASSTLEQALQTNANQVCQDGTLAAFEGAWQEVMRAIESLGLASSPARLSTSKKSTAIDQNKVQELVTSCLFTFEEDQSNATECLHALQSQLGGHHYESLEKLAEHINNYDFEDAQAQLVKLAKQLGLPRED